MHDLLVIGGGINGCGIAVDAAGRGLSVTLVEQGDLACATSSNSSKLIHGGLRYLEHYEFRLVHEALKEREVLWQKAPHIAWPLRFRLPHQRGGRPNWLVRLGLFLYDHLGKRVSLPSTSSWRDTSGLLQPHATAGFEYSDLWVDDARLVVLNARQAEQLGADIRTRTRFVGARDCTTHWEVEVQKGDEKETIQARAIVNAAGPWVDNVFNATQRPSPHPARLIKGSHIVVPKLYDEERAFILPNHDQRVIFVLPWLDHFSLIGTTDVEITGDPGAVECSDQEQAYLLDAANRFFQRQLTDADVKWRYAGVRPLLDDGDGSAQKVTRDYQLVLNQKGAPLLSVHGGKLTTYRTLAQKAVDKLSELFPNMGARWTHAAPLPGAQDYDENRLCARLSDSGLSEITQRRFRRSYGMEALSLIDHDLGQDFGHEFFEAELQWMVEHEFAQTAQDALFRRSKMGVILDAEQRAAVEAWFDQNISSDRSPNRLRSRAS